MLATWLRKTSMSPPSLTTSSVVELGMMPLYSVSSLPSHLVTKPSPLRRMSEAVPLKLESWMLTRHFWPLTSK